MQPMRWAFGSELRHRSGSSHAATKNRRAISRDANSYAVTAPWHAKQSRVYSRANPLQRHAPGEIFDGKDFLEASALIIDVRNRNELIAEGLVGRDQINLKGAIWPKSLERLSPTRKT